jgi:enolase
MFIEVIVAREILDSRGNPTVEVEVVLQDGTIARASVPSGASTGEGEAVELRDGDKKRYGGKGVLKAVANVNEKLAAALHDADGLDQRALDLELIRLDGTANKGNMGANATLGISEAVARAVAESVGMPLYRYLGGAYAHRLPVPMLNVLNGGSHADNNVDVQEFMLVPVGAPSFREALRWGTETYHALKALLKEKKLSTAIGDEGGFAPNLDSDEDALKLLVEAIARAGFAPGTDIALALDVAASSAWQEKCGTYQIGKPRTSADLVALYGDWIAKYPMVSIEDGIGEHDHDGWKALTRALGSKTQLVMDDYVVTNPALIREAIGNSIGNAVLIKPNQIGTVTETLEAIELTKRAGYNIVVSHRSGETEDSFIADLAVAVNADFIKTGAPCRMDRLAKYNQLIRIEEELGDAARFAGVEVLARWRR